MAPGEAFVPSLREYAALYGITPERVRPGQVVMHPGPMNRGVEIDPRVADSDAALVADQVRAGLVVRMAVLYDLLDRDAGSCACDRRGRVILACRNGRGDSLSLEGRVVAPAQGIDECLRVTVTDGVISALEPGQASTLVIAPAFVDPHVHLRTPGREDEETLRSGTEAAAAGGYCAILAHAEHGADRRLRRGARCADRESSRRSRDPDRVHGRDQQGSGRRAAERDGRARRGRRRCVHRRRAAGYLCRSHAPRAPVQRARRAPAGAPLRGARALARRPRTRGSRLGRARPRPVSVDRGEPDGATRSRARGRHGAPAAPHAPLRAGVGRGARARPRGGRRRLRGGDTAPPLPHGRGRPKPRSEHEDESAAPRRRGPQWR